MWLDVGINGIVKFESEGGIYGVFDNFLNLVKTPIN